MRGKELVLVFIDIMCERTAKKHTGLFRKPCAYLIFGGEKWRIPSPSAFNPLATFHIPNQYNKPVHNRLINLLWRGLLYWFGIYGCS